MSATLVLICQRVMPGTLRRLTVTNRRKVGTTSSHHGLYVQGYTRATMGGTEGRKPARGSQSHKAVLSPDRSLQLDCVKSESLVIANQNVAVKTIERRGGGEMNYILKERQKQQTAISLIKVIVSN